MTAVEVGRLPDLLAEAAVRHRVPGAQVAVFSGGVLTTAEHGRERQGGAEPVSASSCFSFGSVTKAFTAALVLQLVAEGDIDLDEPVGELLPDLGGLGERITPRQLLTHTSGLPAEHHPVAGTSLAAYPRACAVLEPVCGPGTAFSYSNVGYALLGCLVEAAIGVNWWEAVDLLVLAPAGLPPSFRVLPRGSDAAVRPVPGHSAPAGRDPAIPIDGVLAEFLAPAGALAGSAVDLAGFGLALAGRRGPVFAPSDLARMRADSGLSPHGLADGWGLGLARFRVGGVDWFGHDGATDGSTCAFRFEPVTGTVLALTANAATGGALWRDLVRAAGVPELAGPGQVAPPTRASAESLDGCAGRYANGETAYSVVAEEGGLRFDLGGGARVPLVVGSDLGFAALLPAAGGIAFTGRFLGDPELGRVDLVEVGGRLAKRTTGA